MSGAPDILPAVNAVAFSLLAISCMGRWRRNPEAGIRWATLAFGCLALVGILGVLLRSSPTPPLASWFTRLILCLLILFPFFLYRFATAFQQPSRVVARTAHLATALMMIASLSLPYLPRPGGPEPGWWFAYRLGVVGQWTILFSIVAARLWVSARGEATVVRCRMRTLAVAATGLNITVLVRVVGVSAHTETLVVPTQGLSLVSALLFFIGLAPPDWLIGIWRRPEQLAFQGAMEALFRAEQHSDIGAILLPRAAGLVGARGAALVERSGRVIASHGPIQPELEALRADEPVEGVRAGVHRIELRTATLLLWTSDYAPFFGPEEFAMTESLGAFADIVLDRCGLAERQRQTEATLNYQASHDKLTGLPNRVLLEERLTQALGRSDAASRVAVLFLDVDRFKVINDSLGHAVGDELLSVLARRLQSSIRPGDTIARFGGDEFVIVTEDWAAADGPTALAARLGRSLETPLCVAGTNVVTTVSIGVAVAAEDHDAGALLRDADAAMYQAKEHGRDRWVLFDADMRHAAKQRLETENDLRRALACGELRVHYQPLVEIVSGRISGVEALVRWAKDEDTLILPKDFIAVAEETGLIIQLGAAVLREACRQVATWGREIHGLGQLSLSVNLSASELIDPGIVEQVKGAVNGSGLEPSRLCLEITESVLLDDTESCARSLRALEALGVRVAVDDFGTGYSSLTYLKRLAVDTLKIDQSFVAGLGQTASHDRAIVAGIIDLAHAFGLTTVAEGVETADQVAQLHALGCQIAQGHHFCRALPPGEAAQWIRAWEAPVEVSAGPGTRAVLPARSMAGAAGLDRWILSDPLTGEAARRRLQTEEALRQALGHGGELRVHYEPVVEIMSGRITGLVAHARWAKDEDTLILPAVFTGVAEEKGLTVQVGATVLDEACRQVASWQSKIHGLSELSLSVDLPASQLLEPGPLQELLEAVASAGLEPSRLCLHITPRMPVDDLETCAQALRALQALGVRVAVDDYETCRSLVHGHRIDVEILKIDPSLVARLGKGGSVPAAVVAGIIGLAHGAGLTTVAQGVETAEQVAQLHALGCQRAQGHHFGGPLPAGEAAEWMRAWETPATATLAVGSGAALSGRIRVLVVDDQGAMRNLLRLTLEFEPDFSVVGEASDGREAVAMARHHQPDLVVLDLAMPGVGGLEALPLIRAVAPAARVVVLSGLDPVDVADLAEGEGVAGYMYKGGSPNGLLDDLRRILASDGPRYSEGRDVASRLHAGA